MIPASNVRHLMLREVVVEACRQGQFHVWAVNTIDEGVEVLTGVKAGRQGKRGEFTRGSVHARVAAKLKTIADQLDGGRKEREEEPEEKELEKEEGESKTRRRKKK